MKRPGKYIGAFFLCNLVNTPNYVGQNYTPQKIRIQKEKANFALQTFYIKSYEKNMAIHDCVVGKYVCNGSI
jgi:hypothetical protein